MAEAIEVKGVYGSYKVIRHLSGADYSCKCTACGAKEKLKAAALRKRPSCPACAEQAEEAAATAKDLMHNYSVKIGEQLRQHTGEDAEEAIASLFGKDSDHIMNLIESTTDKERGVAMFQVKMLITLLDLIPIAEAKVRDSGGAQSAIYGLNALVNSVREIINDIQASQEQTNLAANIGVKVMHPLISLFGNMYVTQVNALRQGLHPHVKDGRWPQAEKMLLDSFRELGKGTEELYAKFQENLEAFLE